MTQIKKETRHERTKEKSTSKKKLWDNTHPLSATCNSIWISHPPSPCLSHPHTIHNNNTMDTQFLVQMRQSNKFGSVRNDEIFNLHLRSGAGPWVSIPCLLQDTSHIYWFHLPKQLTTKKEKNPEIKLNSQQTVSYCFDLLTQNPGLRNKDLEARPKRGTDKINMLKWGRKTAEENKSYRTAWTHIWIPAFKEIGLEPSTRRGANRTKALVSLYWSSQSLDPK